MNSIRSGLIEPRVAFRLPLASRRPQGKLRRASWPIVESYNCQARPCRLCSSRLSESGPACCGRKRDERSAAMRPETKMKRDEIEQLRERVGCQAVLETAGFALDARESTKRAMKYRRGGEIIIVTHSGRGWFDPLGEQKGDVFGLVSALEGCDFLDGCARVAALCDFRPSEPIWRRDDSESMNPASLAEEWARRRSPWPGSATWRYLRWQRTLPVFVIRAAISQNLLREGPYGSMWAAHVDEESKIRGWEGRGPEWRGFATGGSKVLFRFGDREAIRLCVTEAAIDAMSLAAIEGMREGTAYLSTGGGWAPASVAALRRLGERPDALLVAATDNNPQGDVFADRLRALADDVGCSWLRLRPAADDWNEVLKQREKEKGERGMKERDVPHTRQPHQGRLRPAAPALDPANGQAGVPEGVLKD